LTDPGARIKRIVLQTLTARYISAPVIFLLVFVGVFLVPWWRSRRWQGTILLGVSLLQGLLLLTVDQAWNRYLFTLIPLLLLWSGAGLEWIATCASTRMVRVTGRLHRVALHGVCLIGGAAIAVAAFGTVRTLGEFRMGTDRVSKEIGQWIAMDARLRPATGRPILMGYALSSAYYGGGTMRYLPYANEQAALNYIHQMQPHYIVVHGFESQYTPYAESWLQRGIPDPCASLAREEWSSTSDRSRVWRWHCGASDLR
jgi:hypothetical protein